MAIKIIKEGPKEFIVTCTRCGTVFSYELSDLVEYGNYAICPSCGSKCYHFISNTATELPVKDSNIQYTCTESYEKIPYWMRPDYKAPDVTCGVDNSVNNLLNTDTLSNS